MLVANYFIQRYRVSLLVLLYCRHFLPYILFLGVIETHTNRAEKKNIGKHPTYTYVTIVQKSFYTSSIFVATNRRTVAAA